MLTSTKWGISYPNPARGDRADVPADIGAIIASLEAIGAQWAAGTLAARPAFGKAGRFYIATDQVPVTLYFDSGTAWLQLGGPTSLFGTRAARPAAAAQYTGFTYFATDQRSSWLCDGTTWYRTGAQAGDLIHTLENAARTGYALPGSTISRTGVGADLFAIYGTTYGVGDGSTTFTLPDIDGRSLVSKGSHASVDTIGKNEGEIASHRTPIHKSSVDEHGGHHHSYQAPTDEVFQTPNFNPGSWQHTRGAANTSDNVTGITVGPQTGLVPTDTGAFFVAQIQIKL